MSISRLWFGWSCKMLPLRETAWRVHGLSFVLFLTMHVHLQLSQNKKLWKKFVALSWEKLLFPNSIDGRLGHVLLWPMKCEQRQRWAAALRVRSLFAMFSSPSAMRTGKVQTEVAGWASTGLGEEHNQPTVDKFCEQESNLCHHEPLRCEGYLLLRHILTQCSSDSVARSGTI